MAGTESSAWWEDPHLSRTWAAITDRLEREGLEPRGRVGVTALSREERHALGDLLGRPVLTSGVRIDLASLDHRLRERAGVGVVEAAEHVTGRSLTDRPATRARREMRLDAPRGILEQWRTVHPGPEWQALDGWLAGLRRDGVLAREPDPASLVREALAVLWEQRGHVVAGDDASASPVARTELAARVTGDAHALDDDRRLTAVVLRAARHLGLGPEADQPDEADRGERSRRSVWEDLGVLGDRVSSTCLTLGLTPGPHAGQSRSGVSARLAAYHADGAVLHLTWRDLTDGLGFAPGQTVLVCENPRVVEAAAERRMNGVGLVCTSGRPALVTIEVLERLAGAGCRLLYHGDFDWAGLAMANDLIGRCGVQPWRMSVEDYLATPARLALHGRRVGAIWDDELAPAMEHRGLAVHEEACLPGLLTHLSGLAQ